jgi:aconitate hydratase
MLRKKGVVGKFVEFYGPGLVNLSLADRATVANMGPEYGATCGIFPPDVRTLDYLRLSGLDPEQIELVERYMKAQGLFWTKDTPEPDFTDTLELDISTVQPSLAGPKRPQDRILLDDMKTSFLGVLPALKDAALKVPAKTPSKLALVSDGGGPAAEGRITSHEGGAVEIEAKEEKFSLSDGSLVIAAITSCTNTSNPSVMLGAGLLAKKAVERGLTVKPWVKTSLAPGSQVVTDYLEAAGVVPYLDALRFQLVGYGCTTCIGNSGPLPPVVSEAVDVGQLVVASVLSGNRNFEGRVNPQTRANYLASPPLVVAYALAGRVDIDMRNEPLGTGKDGKPVFLADIWPSAEEVKAAVDGAVRAEMFQKRYAKVFEGDERWQAFQVPEGDTYAWSDASTYIKHPPYFEGMTLDTGKFAPIEGARVLALFGDSVTTDHISPAGAIKADSPAGRYLRELGVEQNEFNSFGSRRGNHEVMMRGTFGNIRIRNRLVPGVEGGYDAAMKYKSESVSTIVIAGKEYGTGSSRDWAAKGPSLQGVRAVIAESFERIHRSNLVGMGIIPLEFLSGESAEKLGLDGTETYTIEGVADGLGDGFASGRELKVRASGDDDTGKTFKVKVRIDTPQEVEYVRHGGILHYAIRQLVTAN